MAVEINKTRQSHNAISQDKYGQLLRQSLPRMIANKRQYRQALENTRQLMFVTARSSEQTELLKLFIDRIIRKNIAFHN